MLLASGRVDGAGWLLLLAAAVVATSMSPWGVVTPYLNERFPTAVRSSGFGMGYTLAVIIPSFFGAYMSALDRVMPSQYTQVVLLVVGAALVALGARLGPETVGVELEAADRS